MSIKEIAERAGVSIGTVDRVLHGRGRVSQENIDRVMNIAKEMNYTPNRLASRLSSGKRYVFGVLIPDLDSEFGYWKEVHGGLRDAERELSSQQIDTVFFHYDRRRPESFTEAARRMFSSKVDAYMTAPLIPDGMRRIAEEHPDVPYVFIDSSVPGLSPLADLSQDPEAAGRTAARMMALLGPDIEKVYTVQPFRGMAFNGRMRAEAFDRAYRACGGAEVIDLRSDSAEGLADDIASSSPGKRNGLFVVNDSVNEVCSVLEDRGMLESFVTIGFDLSPENRKRLRDGSVHALLGQRPHTQAHDALTFLYRRCVLGMEDTIDECPVDIFIRENMPEGDSWN